MAKYILTNKAVGDLSGIWNYTSDVWSEVQADKYYFMLLESFQELADGEVAGKNYTAIKEGLFGFKIGQHIVFYRKVKNHVIEIARILHNRMDLKNKMLE